MTIHKKNNLSWYTGSLLAEAGVQHGFFMRHGGCSPQPWYSLNLATSVGDSRENVIENRNRIADALGVARDSYYDVWQVHSARVVRADRPRRLEEKHLQADAIVSDRKGVTILMLFADCVPMLFYDPVKRVVAAAHGGWQGTFKGVAAATIQAMQTEYNCRPADIMALIGPSILLDNYEVGPEVVQAAREHFDESAGVVQNVKGNTHVDLQLANQLFLERAGVQQIEQSGIGTMANTADWFSHRGEKGQAGRFGAVITLGRND
ncbi:MAG: purine-nucleoside/S-methyl-5-thioadenosine phosphorylase / adenosine deaminase [Chloroflexota bacterium]|nr:purine-nucleoside/S-methyl-5-thioadenosine phosphorylase / adenosine deaminase [Chloroflexota bacterium]